MYEMSNKYGIPWKRNLSRYQDVKVEFSRMLNACSDAIRIQHTGSALIIIIDAVDELSSKYAS